MTPKGNDQAMTRKAMELRKCLLNDAEIFHRGETVALQFAIETSNKEHGTNNKQQMPTEIKTRPAKKDRNQEKHSLGMKNLSYSKISSVSLGV